MRSLFFKILEVFVESVLLYPRHFTWLRSSAIEYEWTETAFVSAPLYVVLGIFVAFFGIFGYIGMPQYGHQMLWWALWLYLAGGVAFLIRTIFALISDSAADMVEQQIT